MGLDTQLHGVRCNYFMRVCACTDAETYASAAYGGPAALAGRLHESAANWTAKGELGFLNSWYVLQNRSSQLNSV